MNSSRTRSPQKLTILVTLVAITALGLFLAFDVSKKQAWLFIIGTAFGITLMHAMFGFTGGWRQFIRERDSRGVRAQILLLGLTCLVFFPIFGKLFPSLNPFPSLGPVSMSVFVGAFLFGIGMQLGGGCGSGTLYTVGQGQVDMLVTLIFFIVGATLGTAHITWWESALPGVGKVSLIKQLGWIEALISQVTTLAVLYFLVSWLDRRNNGNNVHPSPDTPSQTSFTRVIRGPWSLWLAVIILVILNLLTLLVANHPWSITFAFGLWGAKFYQAVGGDPGSWTFWGGTYQALALKRSVLFDTTSIMNFGIILGAVLAAALAGKYAPEFRITRTRLFTAILGGLLLGYGARLAYGCNIGALLGGVSSGSLHGWLWLVAAFIGSIVGVYIRIMLKLDPALKKA